MIDDTVVNEFIRQLREDPVCKAMWERMCAQERDGQGIKAYLRETAARDIDPDELNEIVKFVRLLREKSGSDSQ